jgi:hypothetical protein
MYDIFYVSAGPIEENSWLSFKKRYPIAQKIEYVTSYDQIRSKAFTKMFWIIWNDLTLTEHFDLNSYRVTKWDDTYVHVFKNLNYYNGICLCPKNISITEREYQHRFFLKRKEVDVIASYPSKYQRFELSSYDSYLHAFNTSETDMFWGVWPDIEIGKNFNFDYYVPYYDSYQRNITHVFKNGETYDGICLFSKSVKVSKKEFDHRFFVDKKEIDIIASTPRQFDFFNLSSYDDYKVAMQDSKTDMFWGRWPEIEILDTSILQLYFSHHETYERSENHMFKNLCNDEESFLNGLVLYSKKKEITQREFDRRYLINKKLHDKVVSRFRYPRFIVDSYNKYLEISKSTNQKMFWGVWPEVEILDDKVFDIYFNVNDGKYDHDRLENHVFKHSFRNEETYINGIVLFSKEKIISQREFDHRYLIERKEWDILASKLRPYDIIFISYNEPNADENFSKLKNKFSRAKRIHNIKGIHQAHIEAAKISETDMFFVVDGDAIIKDDFNFDYEVPVYEQETVHVWRSQNPINDLTYGYGGVKLLPKKLTVAMDTNSADMTTSISKNFKVLEEISNISAFNTDEFSTWRSAFRECAKLSSKTIQGQITEETIARLEVWTTKGEQRKFGYWAIAGARAGCSFGKSCGDKIHLINNFDWLKEQFDNAT